ncbi:MAG: response regulator [Ktedonobacterales bacterium]|nr:response regulator [Ktedonobacterales bacterium]
MKDFGAGATILLIDDDPHLLPVLEIMVQTFTQCRVVTAVDGVAGLERVAETMPDCIVVDVKMPHLDGHQFARALRGDPATAEIPLIILTALVQDAERFAGMATGADVYLTKPVPPQELLAAIQRAVTITAEQRNQRLQALVEASEQRHSDVPPKGAPTR